MDKQSKVGLSLWVAVVLLGSINLALFVKGMDRADALGTSGGFSSFEWLLFGVWVLVILSAVGYTLWFAANKFLLQR